MNQSQRARKKNERLCLNCDCVIGSDEILCSSSCEETWAFEQQGIDPSDRVMEKAYQLFGSDGEEPHSGDEI